MRFFTSRNLLIILLVISVSTVAGIRYAFASGDDINQTTKVTQSNDMNNQTAGDVNVGGDQVNVSGDNSKALGIGHALGDVDIAQCLGSTQWGTPVFSKQKLVINWPCMAEFYLRNGKPELAAMAICNTEVIDEFEDEASCEAAHDFLAALPAPAPVPLAAVDDHLEEEDEYHEEQLILYEDLLAKVANLEAEVESIPPPEIVERTVIEQRGLTDAQKVALREVVK